MKADVVTIFPGLVEAVLAEGVVGRARTRGLIDVKVHDLRAFTTDRHRTVDDVPYGGGPGMVMKAEPLFAAVEAVSRERGTPAAVLLTSPQGQPLTQAVAERFSRLPHLVFLCGRYEGIDERVASHLATEEISIGDYVLTGGELPALVVLDAVVRLLPGVVGDPESVAGDSFGRGLLDHPHYTRPAVFRDQVVPDVLVSGHHAAIARWRAGERVRRTRARRPDLLARAVLTLEEQHALEDVTGNAEASAAGWDRAESKERDHEGD